jgi:hypothetical protein
LRPAELYRQPHDFRGLRVGRVKRPHTAQIAGRKTIDHWIGRLQIFGSCNSRTFFGPARDKSANLAVQFHL